MERQLPQLARAVLGEYNADTPIWAVVRRIWEILMRTDHYSFVNAMQLTVVETDAKNRSILARIEEWDNLVDTRIPVFLARVKNTNSGVAYTVYHSANLLGPFKPPMVLTPLKRLDVCLVKQDIEQFVSQFGPYRLEGHLV